MSIIEESRGLCLPQYPSNRSSLNRLLLLSTLREYVEAIWGRFSLIAEFRDREPALLSGIAEEKLEPKSVATKPSCAGKKSAVMKPRKSA
jgi:hypothetical protein